LIHFQGDTVKENASKANNQGNSFQPKNFFILIRIGNAFSIVVLSSAEMRSSFNQLLTALASFDIVYLFVSVMVFGLPKLSSAYGDYILPRVMPIA
jgi:hypothetical protein